MKCNLCGSLCNVDRNKKLGACGLDYGIYISYSGLHFGEEPFLVGRGGSGTVFFLGCNLRCQFCQNYQISRWTSSPFSMKMERGVGGERARKVNIEELVQIFFDLKEQGAVNINLVSPTPYVYQIAEALKIAKEKNLNLPIVYNSHGYDSLEAANLMKGLIDIYLPDLKYTDDKLGKKYSGIPNYFSRNKETLKAMHEQVGLLQLDKNELATKGLVVRHLVLPDNLENSFKALDFLARLDKNIAISLMAQYHPVKSLLPEISTELQRALRPDEYAQVVKYAFKLGLENCLVQEMDSHEHYLPDFQKEAGIFS